MKLSLAPIALAAAIATPAIAQIAGSAAFTTQSVAGQFHYSGTLHNTGTTNIGTMWFAWIPGYDFLPHTPTNITSPPGWTAQPMTFGPGDGTSIQWVASSPATALAPGQSLPGFGFDSPDAPATLRGLAPNFPLYPVAETYIYIGGPELDPGGRFVASIADAACYPNCDSSTAAPILNVNDFICFQQRFAAGDSYANCDSSTQSPVLNVNDFICFQQRFAAGCS